MVKISTCCFTGLQKLPKEKIEQILTRFDYEVENLIKQGVTTFISAGMPGFDQLAASLIVAKKEMGKKIRLVFALACKNQDEFWNTEQKGLYTNLLGEADEVICVSEEYYSGCVEKRDRFMVDHSAYCICALIYPGGDILQTIRYAREKGLKIINVAAR